MKDKIEKLIDLTKKIMEVTPPHEGFSFSGSLTTYFADEFREGYKQIAIGYYGDKIVIALHGIPTITFTAKSFENIDIHIASLEDELEKLSPSNKTKQAEIAFLEARLAKLKA